MNRIELKIISPKLKSLILFTLSLFFIFFLTNQVSACGPFFPYYVYTPEDIEEKLNSPFYSIDIESFLNSKYGIISSGWCPQSLYFVYRNLTNNKLNQQEKEQLSRYYKKEFYKVGQQWKEAVNSWRGARKLVTKNDIIIEKYKKDNYTSYINCLPDAFLTAARTLKKRAKIYSSEELKIWLDKQDEVFSQCGNKPQTKRTNISSLKLLKPRKIETNESPVKKKGNNRKLLQYDYEYQQAALHFYKGDYEESEKRFKSIAGVPNHPWQVYSTLALGRTYIRKANSEYDKARQSGKNNKEALEIRNESLQKAKVQFENILKNDSLWSIHRAAKSLLNYVNFRINPDKRFKDAEEVLLTSHDPEEIVNNLEDFFRLFP